MKTRRKAAALSHLDEAGKARMVDVGDKPVSERRAVAEGRVRINAELERAILDDSLVKGNLLEVARLAGIMAAKRTDALIPLCHGLPLDHVNVDLRVGRGSVHIRAEVRTSARTGVEMEAFTAVAVAALTVIDMGKAVDAGMVVDGIRLIDKSGGRRGRLSPHASDFPDA